jgi:beta-fructofuranosidase
LPARLFTMCRTTPPVVLALIALVVTCRTGPAAESPSPKDVLATAKSIWHMGPGPMEIRGDAATGFALAGPERESSLQRGGDGRVAELRGGAIVVGGPEKPHVAGKSMSLCLRLRDPSGTWEGPIVSRSVPGKDPVAILFGSDVSSLRMGDRERRRLVGNRALTYQWKTRPGAEHVRPEIYQTSEKGRLDQPAYKQGILRVSAPLDLVGPSDWHDVIVRFDDARLELFVDGVLVDEEWPHGALEGFQGPFVLGPVQDGAPSFRGQVDHLAVWDRALTDAEIVALSGGTQTVAKRTEEILGPESPNPQYWRPQGYNAYVGDCMPFFHDGTFHFYYLFDRRHHGSKWAMGAHQFGHASSRDLVHWEYHPLALPITDQAEPSLGTGLCVFHDNLYHLFYIPHYRRGYFTDSALLGDDVRVATSDDGIHFTKRPDPVAKLEYRTGGDVNPNVFRDEVEKRFILAVAGRFYASTDLLHWDATHDFTTAEIPAWSCTCAFEWNGWRYYSAWQNVRKTRKPIGPGQGGWTDAPGLGDALFCPQVAAFTGNRRLLVGFVDDGAWGSSAVFRELVQHPNGDLGTRWVPEMIPPCGKPVPVATSVGFGSKDLGGHATFNNIPRNCRVHLRLTPGPGAAEYALVVRATSDRDSGMTLTFRPGEDLVRFDAPKHKLPAPALTRGERALKNVTGLDRPFTLDLIIEDDLLDVCVDNRRTYIVHVPTWLDDRARDAGLAHEGKPGETLVLYTEKGHLQIDDLTIRPLEAR